MTAGSIRARSRQAPTATSGSPRLAGNGSGGSPRRARSPNSQKGSPPAVSPNGIATGPDGNLWFTEADGNRIGRITPTGDGHRVLGRDHTRTADQVDRGGLRREPVVHREQHRHSSGGSPLPARSPSSGVENYFDAGAGGVVAGPDGNLWFTNPGDNGPGRYSGSGASPRPGPSPSSRKEFLPTATPARSPQVPTATYGSPS